MSCFNLVYSRVNVYWDFLGGPVVSATHYHCRGMGSIPGLGTKILHATCVGKKKS